MQKCIYLLYQEAIGLTAIIFNAKVSIGAALVSLLLRKDKKYV